METRCRPASKISPDELLHELWLRNFSNITFILRKTSMKTQLAMRISDGFVLQFANFTLNAVEPTQGQICALPS